MMSSRRRALLASAGLLGVPWAALAAANRNILQLRVEYTATSLIGADERAVRGRLWRTRSALRHEGKQHGRSMTVIARLDRNLCWLVLAEPRFAIETDLARSSTRVVTNTVALHKALGGGWSIADAAEREE